MNKWTDPEFDMPSTPQSGDHWEAENQQTETSRIISSMRYPGDDEEYTIISQIQAEEDNQ